MGELDYSLFNDLRDRAGQTPLVKCFENIEKAFRFLIIWHPVASNGAPVPICRSNIGWNVVSRRCQGDTAGSLTSVGKGMTENLVPSTRTKRGQLPPYENCAFSAVFL